MKAAEIAEILKGRVLGDGSVEVKGFSTLEEASEDDISFLSNPKYKRLVEKSRAKVIVTSDESLRRLGKTLIVVDDPYFAAAKLIELFYKESLPEPGIHSASYVEPSSVIGKDVFVGPFVYVGRKSRIGDGVKLISHIFVGDEVEIGDGTVIFPNVTIYKGVRIGKRVRIHSGTVIGSDGFGYVLRKEGAYKIPQVGGVVVGDDVEIGSNCSIDRGTIGDTVIGRGVKIDNLVQIAHNVKIGDNSIIVSQVGVAGSAILGSNVIVAGQAGIAGHVRIGNGVKIGGQSGVTSDVPDGSVVSGTPHMDHGLWRRISVLMRRLPELFSKVRMLEKRLRKLEGEID